MSLKLLTLYNEFSAKNFEKNDDDDLFDKFSRKFSTIMMLIFAFVLSTAQLVGEPIKCWCPNEFSKSRCEYATTHCYITSQYIPVTNGSNIPSREKLLSHQIIYYQWVAYMFLLQAIIFYLPCLVWKSLNTKTGFAIRNYIEELRKDKSLVTNNPAVKYVAAHLDSCLTIRRNYIHRGIIKSTLFKGDRVKALNTSYIFFCHLFVKVLYLLFAILQIVILNYWLRDHHYTIDNKGIFWGVYNWKLQERFPRMTLCKFDVFVHMNDRQIHWLQCTLPMNIFIEKIYIAIWIWLGVLVVVTSIGIVYTMFKALPSYRKRFIEKRLPRNKLDEIEKIYKYLGLDGVLTLSLLSSNTNDVNVNAIINQFTIQNDKK